MGPKLVLTRRDVAEIQHALFYAQRLAHGTAGHNQLMLIATLAKRIGFEIDAYGDIVYPSTTVVGLVEDSGR